MCSCGYRKCVVRKCVMCEIRGVVLLRRVVFHKAFREYSTKTSWVFLFSIQLIVSTAMLFISPVLHMIILILGVGVYLGTLYNISVLHQHFCAEHDYIILH